MITKEIISLSLYFKGNGVLPLNAESESIIIRGIRWVSNMSGAMIIQEQKGDVPQQVMDRLTGRDLKSILFYGRFAPPDITYSSQVLTLKNPSEVEVVFDNAGGILQVVFEIEKEENNNDPAK